MLQRTITGVVMAALFVPVAIFSDTLVLPIVMAVLAAVAMGEMLHCVGLLKNWFITVPTVLVSGAAPMLAYFMLDNPERFFFLLIAAALVLLFLLFSVAVLTHGRVAAPEMSVAFLGAFYIPVAFSCAILLRHHALGDGMFYLIFIGAWATDIFAYFSGYLFGKHKLNPEISPKKTVEGSIGGTLMCVILFVVYGIVMKKIGVMSVNPIALGGIGLVVSVVSQIGDLSMSLIKRHYGVKDYGKIFPGHGGVLDRFDSILATAPFLYLLVIAFTALSWLS